MMNSLKWAMCAFGACAAACSSGEAGAPGAVSAAGQPAAIGGSAAAVSPRPSLAGAGAGAGAAVSVAGRSGAAGVAARGGAAAASGASAVAGRQAGAGASAGASGDGGLSGAGAGASAAAGHGGVLATSGSGGDPAPTAGAGGPAAGSGAVACAAPAANSQGKNPLFSDVYTADPGVLVDNCTFYVHCGHDEGPNGFVLREWFVLSSTDMVNWDRQVALRVSDFAWADANAWAGQAVKKGTKYYWFVPVQQRGGGMAIGVAVGDSPTGPFRDALGKPLIDDAFEMSNVGYRTPPDTPFTIDPSVFIDDDGQAYLHYGGFSRMVVAKLSDDLLSIDGKMREVTPQGFFEAPYLIKRAGVYYEIYAAGVNPATIDYATSDSPLGPWKYGGRILDALPSVRGQDAATSHPAVAEFAGQWYLVYHVSNGPNGGGTYKRQVAVDKLTFRPDGTIEKVTPSTGLRF